MFFKEVVGQADCKERLIQSVKENRVSHAQLFIGPEGCGSLALALAFAQYINCESRQEDDSCGRCPSCVKSQKMIHPDIHYSYPVYKLKAGSENPALSSDFLDKWREAMIENPYRNTTEWLDFINAENKLGNISAAECRDIIRKLILKSFESEYKFLILWRAEYLEKEGNILLKLLEEPPDKTIIILVAENRDEILSTILSRTQLLSVPPISDQDLLQSLMDKLGISREAALKLVRKAEGNYGEALRLTNNIDDNNQELFNRWMQLLYANNASDLVKWVDEISKIGRENQKSFFRYSLEFLHECVVFQQLEESRSRLQEEEKRLAAWLTQRMTPDDWSRMSEYFDRAHYHIERNAHPKILFLHLSLQLQKLISRKKLSLA